MSHTLTRRRCYGACLRCPSSAQPYIVSLRRIVGSSALSCAFQIPQYILRYLSWRLAMISVIWFFNGLRVILQKPLDFFGEIEYNNIVILINALAYGDRSCATECCEPCQAGNRAALSGFLRVPQSACSHNRGHLFFVNWCLSFCGM